MAPKSRPMGYNPDLFSAGQQLVQLPDDHPVWQQPFQDPYNGGGNPFWSQDDGGGGNNIPMGGADYPVGPNSWDQMQPQQPQGPPPSPKQDLNHPFWGQVGQYLGSDSFKDSLLAGAIVGQMATNPQAALQLAVQFKEQRERRKWQAEQNDAQREAVAENVRARAEIEKVNKRQGDFQKRAAKLKALVATHNIDPNPWIAENGELDEDNITKGENDMAGEVARLGAIEKQNKERQQVIKNVVQSGVVPEKYKDDATVTAIAALGADRKAFRDKMDKNRLAIMELRQKLYRKSLAKNADGSASDPMMKVMLTELADLDGARAAVENDIDRLGTESRALGDDVGADVGLKREQLGDLLQRYTTLLDTIRERTGGSGVKLNDGAAAPKKTGNKLDSLLGLGN